MGNYPAHYAYPSSPPLVRVLPPPVRLHWGWVFALSCITLGVFGSVWMFVIAIWVKKVRGTSMAFWWTLANALLLPLFVVVGIGLGVLSMITHVPVADYSSAFDSWGRIVAFALYIAAAFTLRSELGEEPIGLALGGAGTFFVAATYFQYYLHDFSFGHAEGGTLGLTDAVVPIGGLVPVEQDKSL